MTIVYGSVCSGIEAASVAWGPLGWRPAWFAEVDAFPSAVLAHRFPGVRNLGDFTQIDGEPGSIDLLVGGTPCQSFSVAGKRLGLDDPRGNLAIEYLRLALRLQPRWLVWENVPGVLSSNRGRDFGAFLGLLGELGYGWAYRVLDAQHFGVPQRRRRVFVVGCLGDWRRAAAVLFEPESPSGHPPEGRKARPRVAGTLAARPGAGGGLGTDLDCDGGLTIAARCQTSRGNRNDSASDNFIAHTLRADGFDASEDGTGRGTPLIPIDLRQASRGEKLTNNRANGSGGPPGLGVGQKGDPAFTVSERGQCVAFQCHDNNVGPMGTLRKGDGGMTSGVPFIVNAAESCAKKDHARPTSVARCLDSTGSFASSQGGTVVAELRAFNWQTGGDGRLGVSQSPTALQREQTPALHSGMAVRRLTPRECERLQGFPDDWTLIPVKPVPAKSQAKARALSESGDERFADINGVMYFVSADGPRYKAIGNSMAIPCMAWIGRRIDLMEHG